MSNRENEARVLELEEELRKLDATFQDEMLKRGFDPAQAENVALPSGLAKLFAKREEVKAKLDELRTISGGITDGR